MALSWLRILARKLTVSSSRRTRLKQRRRRPLTLKPQVETLEQRDVPTVVFSPDHVIEKSAGKSSLFSSGPTGYSPSQIEAAYGMSGISFNGTAGTGAGETIAIVDAYSDPTITSDLHTFDQEFGLADPKLTVVNQNGGSALPAADPNWAGEIALDVEWAHAVAPGANILLVEASNANNTSLFSAVKYAAAQKGVVAVSMSWGGNEFAGETSYDSSVFTPPASNPNVVFINSAGDSGAPAQYPATSPNVLSVGGTTLNLGSSGGYVSESAWSGGGGGISAYESQPSYQKGVVKQSTTRRTGPDVSYDSDPNTGFPVYQSYGNNTGDPWLQYGGTSDAAPQWAALIAIADQGRALDGESALSSSVLLKDLYSLPSADFHDITTGATDGSPRESAGKGYDLATGLGTPVANLVIAGLVGAGGGVTSTGATQFSISAAPSVTAGNSLTFTVTALNSSNQTVTSFSGAASISSSDQNAVLPSSVTFTKGVATFTVTLTTAGTQSVTVTANGISATDSGITVYPGPVANLVFVQQPSSTGVGATISPAVTVEEVDQYGNVVATDNSSTITLALSANPGGATLSGGGSATVINGVATFAGLSLSAAGTGDTLTATEGKLSVTSAAFNVTASTPGVIEDFSNGLSDYYYEGYNYPLVSTSAAAAHAGSSVGLVDPGDGNWYFRQDSGAVVNPGDTVSVWVNFAGVANGRAYFGFGTTEAGLDSVVLAPNTNQFLIQDNFGFSNYLNLAAAKQTYSANSWYLVQIQWGNSGTVVANLYGSNGTTLLNSITAATADVIPGTFAFRAIGSTKYFSTVTDTPGVNDFATRGGSNFFATTSTSSATGSIGVVASEFSTAGWMMYSSPGRGWGSTSAVNPFAESESYYFPQGWSVWLS
jgi:hypothetical protein